jgi:hypothetical protein
LLSIHKSLINFIFNTSTSIFDLTGHDGFGFIPNASMAAVAPIRLADYTPWAFNLPAIELNVDVQSNHVVVSSRLELKPQSSGSITSAGCRSHD